MAQLTITIRTDNAAFDDDNGGQEVARILRELADAYEDNGEADLVTWCVDINGNKVGQTEFKGRE